MPHALRVKKCRVIPDLPEVLMKIRKGTGINAIAARMGLIVKIITATSKIMSTFERRSGNACAMSVSILRESFMIRLIISPVCLSVK